jgi:large subunit ribosomal protein L19e
MEKMNLSNKRRISSELIGVSPKRIWFDNTQLEDIKSALTREDIRKLISKGIIRSKQKKSVSRGRARKIILQKRKGKRQGSGSRKGRSTARITRKETWINKIRSQRKFIKELIERNRISKKTYSLLRGKAKSGIFRNKRHIKLFLEENKLFLENRNDK